MRKKIKFQGGITKIICQKLAGQRRKQFGKNLRAGKLNVPLSGKDLPFDVISFSGSRDLEEQALSILSFAINAGIPQRWTLYSDGSHSREETRLIQNYFPFVHVSLWNEHEQKLTSHQIRMLNDYIHLSPAARKVTLLSCHPYERQTIYTDSDILFYPASGKQMMEDQYRKGFWYMSDVGWGALDSRVEKEGTVPLNFGFLILNGSFKFDAVFSYLNRISPGFHYFSDQTAFHIAFQEQDGKALDPAKFVLDVSDQFDFGYVRKQDMSVRHFVTPVRHKMWQRDTITFK